MRVDNSGCVTETQFGQLVLHDLYQNSPKTASRTRPPRSPLPAHESVYRCQPTKVSFTIIMTCSAAGPCRCTSVVETNLKDPL